MYIRRPRIKDPREVEKWEDDVSKQLNYLSSKTSQGIVIPGIDGEDGEEGIMGPPGLPGIGTQGPMGIPGRDGEDGEDAWIIPGIETSKVINLIYPVGSIYISIVATNPVNLFGLGTWIQIAEGQMLVGFKTGDPDFGVVEGTGGAKTHTHVGHNNHIVTEPNNHVVTQPDDHTVVADIQGALPGNVVTTGGHSGTDVDAHTGTDVDAHSAHDTVDHLNPFFTVYVWKRTA